MLTTILLSALLLNAEVTDTLQSSCIQAERGISVSRTDTLGSSASANITSLLLQNPALVVADYGGFAGQKSVNLRGLGSTHTRICIDGIRVTNIQSGQPDLSMLDLTNSSQIIIDYAQNSVNFVTARPSFGNSPVNGKASLNAGSFGTWLPAARLNYRINDGISLSASASGIISKGDFPLQDGRLRSNSDIRQIKAGVDAFGRDWGAKLFLNNSDRGVAGSLDWPSTDRQQDCNVFAQGYSTKQFSDFFTLYANGKFSYDNSVYMESKYAQTGFQLNCAQKYSVANWLDLSMNLGYERQAVRSTAYNVARTDLIIYAGASIILNRFRADLTLEHQSMTDTGQHWRNILSPSLDFKYNIIPGLTLNGFARRAYRAPLFNELYYPGYGNPNLLPEDAWLTDLGLDWRHPISRHLTFKAKADAFYNHLSNKIVSAPTADNPSIWLPYNVGEVHSYGADADVSVAYSSGDLTSAFAAQYSFQYAEGVPYLARHSLALTADASFRGYSLAAVFTLKSGRQDSYGPMPDWNTIDLALSKEFRIKAAALTLNLTGRNLAGHRYELVTGYPMPGASLLGGVTFSF